MIPPLWKAASLFRMPKDRRLSIIAAAGIGGVVCAIGDAGSFKKTSKNLFELTLQQLDMISARLDAAGYEAVVSSAVLEAAADENVPAFMLGVEGGDFIGTDLGLLEAVYSRGVRLLVPVHYSANSFGSISLGWGGREIPPEEHTGLTDFGRSLIAEANRLGLVLDLAHADDRTLQEAADASGAPVICSHTGPSGLQNFARYISDESIRRVAGSGGVIGLWPYYLKGKGMASPDDFKKAALYLKDVAGAGAIAVGTDFNGVPGYMRGFADIMQSGHLAGYLSDAGFSDDELEGIFGRNFLRVFKDVEEAAAG